MAIFGNQAVNRIYLHAAIQAFAETGGGVFFLILLLKGGLSASQALCALAAILLGRFVLRRGVLPIARRIGLRRTLMLGTVLESSSYWFTPHVDGLGPVLVLLIGLGAVGSVLYWTSYHAYTAAVGSNDQRGSQVGTIEAINAAIAVIAPGIVSLLLINSGPVFGYAVVAVIQIAAALPLIGAAEVPIPEEADAGRALRREGAIIYFWDGWSVGGVYYVWLIALFVSLGAQIGSYGGTMVVAGLAGAVMSLIVGRFIDLGHGGQSVIVAYSIAIVAVCFKAWSFATPWAAIAAAALGSITAAIRVPVIMARIYNLAQQSGCTLRFNMATEAGFDLGSASCCLIAAALIAHGMAVGFPVLLALPALIAVAILLWKSYQSEKA